MRDFQHCLLFNAIVQFDTMGRDAVHRTFSLIAGTATMYRRLGCTLPARWRRRTGDADRAVAPGLRVRVVKGEWPGRCDDEADPQNGVLNIGEKLAGRAVHVAVATQSCYGASFPTFEGCRHALGARASLWPSAATDAPHCAGRRSPPPHVRSLRTCRTAIPPLELQPESPHRPVPS